MSRYLFTYAGRTEPPAEHLERIGKSAQILDKTLRTLLVNAEPAEVAKLIPNLPDWKIEQEQTTPVPDTRKRVRKPAVSA